MMELGQLSHARIRVEHRAHCLLVAEDEEAQIRTAVDGDGCAADHDIGPGIAPHRVERNRDRLRHQAPTSLRGRPEHNP